jgi:hypothetical protein
MSHHSKSTQEFDFKKSHCAHKLPNLATASFQNGLCLQLANEKVKYHASQLFKLQTA